MFERLIKIINYENFYKIKNSKVLIVGIGGVGGYALECLVRSGVENITIIDGDTVDESNTNRQIIALKNTIGMKKVDVAAKRALDINPNIKINCFDGFLKSENFNNFINEKYDYIIDACDTITTKALLINYAISNNIKIISCMGTGNRLDPTKVTITKLNKTVNDPLSKIMRKLLKDNKNSLNVPVVWSSELPIKTTSRTPGSCITVPMVAGSQLASFIINDIINSD